MSEFALALARSEIERLQAVIQWKSVLRDGPPPCDGETVFVGINSTGFAACFNAISPLDCCVMNTADDSVAQMSCLKFWRVLDRPCRTALASQETPT